MPRASEMIPSKFLKKEDVGAGVLVTVGGVEKVNVAADGAEAEHKWSMHFKELDKPLVLNATNIHILTTILGSDESEVWIGKQVVLYSDPNVSFGGKLVGGIRIRAPRNQAEQTPF